jgi:hypothetical protein
MSLVNFHNNIVSVDYTKAQSLNVKSADILNSEFIQSYITKGNKALLKYYISFKPSKGEVQMMLFSEYVNELKKANVKNAYGILTGEQEEAAPKPKVKKVEQEAAPKQIKKTIEQEDDAVPKPKRGRPAKKEIIKPAEEEVIL